MRRIADLDPGVVAALRRVAAGEGRQPVAAVDMDNTLVDYTGALRFHAQHVAGIDAPCPDPAHYAFWRTPGWPFDDERSFRAFHAQVVAAGLYLDERPFAGATEAIAALRRAGWKVVVMTSRRDERGQSAGWLEVSGVEVDGLYVGDKTLLKPDVVLDDDPAVIARFAARGTLVLHPDHAYCVEAPGVAYHTWGEVATLLASGPDGPARRAGARDERISK